MASTSTKVLSGCAIGCAVLALLGAGAGWLGYRWVQGTIDAVETAESTSARLDEAFGAVRDFVPPPVIPPDRLEVFLAVREELAEPREALAQPILEISQGGRGFSAARAGLSLAPRMMGFAAARNEALLEHGMGRGEYTWIYWLCFHAWLGHPADDSLLHELLAEGSGENGRIHFRMDGGPEPERITWRLRRDVGAMLANLEEALEGEPSMAEVRDAIAAELVAIEEDRGRVPWQDGLPEAVAVGLEPFRDRLESTYSRATNPFELLQFD
jgi:hypothetical protein